MKFLISIVALLLVAGAQAQRPDNAAGGGNPILNVPLPDVSVYTEDGRRVTCAPGQ